MDAPLVHSKCNPASVANFSLLGHFLVVNVISFRNLIVAIIIYFERLKHAEEGR